MVTPLELMDRAREADSIGSLMKEGLGGFLSAIGFVFISGVLTLGELVTAPIQAMTAAVSRLTFAVFGAPADIVLAGAQSTIESLLGPWAIGPLTFPLAVGVVLLTLWLVYAFIAEDETGNVGFLPFDVPTPFLEDPEEEEGDQD